MLLPKPPKLFHSSRQAEVKPQETQEEAVPPVMNESVPAEAIPPVMNESVPEEAGQEAFIPEQPAVAETIPQEPMREEIQPEVMPQPEAMPSFIAETDSIPSMPDLTDEVKKDEETPLVSQETIKEEKKFDESRYARPSAARAEDAGYVPEMDFTSEYEETEQVIEDNSYPLEDIIPADMGGENMNKKPKTKGAEVSGTNSHEEEEAIEKYLGPSQEVVRALSVSSVPFSDIWYTAEKIAYIRDENTRFALVPFVTEDMEDFYKALEQGYTGSSSYAIRFANESYRVERIMTLAGIQYNCRKMPTKVPDIYELGLPKHIVDYIITLSRESGLILFGGPTGMGKTTSATALMKKFLEIDGGFMYTVEDPPEMPIEGLYRAQNGGLGLCKQCPVDNERWGDGIKSALRSRPRYILVGEIRTPETASQVLRAATSGHLVLSTIHASTVEDALESLIKYASGAGLTESLAADLLARGILGVVHQKLEGQTKLRPVITSCFANPHLSGGDQMRSLIRSTHINLQTLIEAQSSRMFQGRPLFDKDDENTKNQP